MKTHLKLLTILMGLFFSNQTFAASAEAGTDAFDREGGQPTIRISPENFSAAAAASAETEVNELDHDRVHTMRIVNGESEIARGKDGFTIILPDQTLEIGENRKWTDLVRFIGASNKEFYDAARAYLGEGSSIFVGEPLPSEAISMLNRYFSGEYGIITALEGQVLINASAVHIGDLVGEPSAHLPMGVVGGLVGKSSAYFISMDGVTITNAPEVVGHHIEGTIGGKPAEETSTGSATSHAGLIGVVPQGTLGGDVTLTSIGSITSGHVSGEPAEETTE